MPDRGHWRAGGVPRPVAPLPNTKRHLCSSRVHHLHSRIHDLLELRPGGCVPSRLGSAMLRSFARRYTGATLVRQLHVVRKVCLLSPPLPPSSLRAGPHAPVSAGPTHVHSVGWAPDDPCSERDADAAAPNRRTRTTAARARLASSTWTITAPSLPTVSGVVRPTLDEDNVGGACRENWTRWETAPTPSPAPAPFIACSCRSSVDPQCVRVRVQAICVTSFSSCSGFAAPCSTRYQSRLSA